MLRKCSSPCFELTGFALWESLLTSFTAPSIRLSKIMAKHRGVGPHALGYHDSHREWIEGLLSYCHGPKPYFSAPLYAKPFGGCHHKRPSFWAYKAIPYCGGTICTLTLLNTVVGTRPSRARAPPNCINWFDRFGKHPCVVPS